MDFTFNIFLQLFISNVQVVTNMSSGVTSNSKYTTYGVPDNVVSKGRVKPCWGVSASVP